MEHPGNGQPNVLIALVTTPNGPAVNGPVDDIVTSLGLLELAKQLVIEHNKLRTAAQPRVVPVAGLPPQMLVKRG